MKKVYKLLVFLLALCQLTCVFAACQKDESEVTSDTAETTQADDAFALTIDNLGQYVIVVPEEKAKELNAVVSKLQRMVKLDTGLDIPIVTDATEPAEYEILVGEVNREEATAFYKTAKHYDWGYALVGKKVLIVGCEVTTINESVWMFIPGVLEKMDETGLFLKGDVKVIHTDEEKNRQYEWLQSTMSFYCDALEGVTVNAMGDSYFEGDGIGKENTWLGLLGTKYNMQMNNYGKGGSTISNYVTSGRNPMCDRYMNMATKADIIIVEGGRNDFNHDVPIGEVDSQDTTTFSGALNVIIDGLQEKYPNAMIVCLSAWNFPGSKYGRYYYDYTDAMEAVAESQGVYYIKACDPEVSGVDMTKESFRLKYCNKSSDVSHLNVAGMKYVMPYLEKALAACYTDFLGKK